jgi:FdhD protein
MGNLGGFRVVDSEAVLTAEFLGSLYQRCTGGIDAGLCGIESIADATEPAPMVGPGPTFSPGQILAAMRGIRALQKIHADTHAVHAAALWTKKTAS